MAKRGGFPGMMPGNMNGMLKQVQKMQADMQKMQEELSNKEFESTVGGGAVTARVNGKKELVSVKIVCLQVCLHLQVGLAYQDYSS